MLSHILQLGKVGLMDTKPKELGYSNAIVESACLG